MTSPVHQAIQIEDFDAWVGELKQKIDKLAQEISSSQQQYRFRHPGWESSLDARSAWFTGMLCDVLPFAVVDLYYIRDTLTYPDIWQKAFGRTVTDSDLPKILEPYEQRLRFTSLHTTYAMLEAIVRRICEAVDSQFYFRNKRNMAAITERLLNTTDLTRFGTLFDLARTIRNSIHNNGVYLPENGQNRIITWAGVSYVFHTGESVAILFWEFLLQHWRELNEAITAIVLHPKIANIASIPRLY